MNYIITTSGIFNKYDFWDDKNLPIEVILDLGIVEVEANSRKIIKGLDVFKDVYNSDLQLYSITKPIINNEKEFEHIEVEYFMRRNLVLGFLTDENNDPYYGMSLKLDNGEVYNMKMRYCGILDIQFKY